MSAAHAIERRTVREQLDDLVIVPDVFHRTSELLDKTLAWEGVLATHSADDECAHGRLPSDRTPPCGCFAGEMLS